MTKNSILRAIAVPVAAIAAVYGAVTFVGCSSKEENPPPPPPEPFRGHVFLEKLLTTSLGTSSPDYKFMHNSSSPNGKFMFVAVNEAVEPGGAVTGKVIMYILDAAKLEQGEAVKLSETSAQGGGKTVSFRSNWTADNSKIVVAAADRVFVVAVNADGTQMTVTNGPTIGLDPLDNSQKENHDALPTSDGHYAVLTIRNKKDSGRVPLATPANLAATPAETGGTLAAGTYYYVVTAINSFGSTLASNEVSADIAGSTGSVALTWDVVANATGYRVYFGTSAGGENKYYLPGNVTTFTDTGATAEATTDALPTTDGTAPMSVDGSLQLYDIVNNTLVGPPVTVCAGCHANTKSTTLCGIDGVLTPSGNTYTGTVYVAGHGGHFAKAALTITPADATPIAVSDNQKLEITTAKFPSTDPASRANTSTHKLHDARLEGSTLYWSTYNLDANNKAHYGKINIDGSGRVDKSISLPSRATIGMKGTSLPQINAMPIYCASGQTTTAFFPSTMTNEAYITVIPKADIQ